jgi:uncharacterized protein DUF4352
VEVTSYLPEIKTVIVYLTPVAPLLPTEKIVYGDLEIAMDAYETSGEYATEFSRIESPPEATKFVWVHITVKNIGIGAEKIPHFSQFSLFYEATQIEAMYGHRQDFPDYANQNFSDDRIQPAQIREGWLRFIVPSSADSSDLLFAFNESSTAFMSGTPYVVEGQHAYFWKLTP